MRWPRTNERGASLVLITASLLLLFGLAAIAIDIGATKDERGFDQHAADASALGGALELGLTGSYQAAVTEVKRLVNANLGTVTDADWIACTDPSPLNPTTTAAALGLAPATTCISFFEDSLVRVRIPDQVVDASFGRVLGASELTTFAVAVARVDAFQGVSNPPPFVVPASSSTGELLCLRTSPSSTPMPNLWEGRGPGNTATQTGPADPCDDATYDPASEFFGTLDPKTYFDPATGNVVCQQTQVEWAMAIGIDHALSSWDPDFVVGATDPTGPAVNEDGCNPDPVDAVNTMPLKSGLSAQELRCGMLSLKGGICDSVVRGPNGATAPPRLQTGENSPSTRFLEELLDDRPLWEFLVDTDDASISVPPSCDDLADNVTDPDWDFFDKKDRLLDCLTDWNPATHDPIFTNDIDSTPRFAFIPYLAESNLASAPSACISSAAPQCVHFNDFVPVFIQTLYSDVSGGASRGGCDPGGPGSRWIRQDAGEGGSCGRDNDNLNRLASIVLDCRMLPANLCESAPGGPTGRPVPAVELVD